MAKKGLVLAEWSAGRRRRNEDEVLAGTVETIYALREDGKLISKTTWYLPSGTKDFGGDWKLIAKVKGGSNTERIMRLNRRFEGQGLKRVS